MTWKRCVICGEGADALENNTPYCSKHWFKFFTTGGQNGKSKGFVDGYGRGRSGSQPRGLDREARRESD
tara:strand:+ start:1494 stop:1700 length:207 start_codon:yes stop_codon:yes gene_type:complete